MKPKTMILLGLAITCGLGASYMTSRLLAERTTPEEERVTILVAKRNLSIGERLAKPEELFEPKEVTKENEPPDAIREFEGLKGKIMKQARNKGEHVTASNLLGEKDGLNIPEGHKAMGLRVNLEGTASGFATLPQSRVDLIWTVRGGDSGASYSKVLLERVLVLAADLKLTRDGELATPAQVVTFALTNEDILKVHCAKEDGILTLVLRNLDDHEESSVKEFRGSKLRKKEEPTAKIEPVKPPEPVKVESVVEAPKFVQSYFDSVSGTETGPREVTRTHYKKFDDGTVVIERTELIETTRVTPQGTPSIGANPKKGPGPRDF